MTASSTPDVALAIGVVALEFSAAVQTFVSSTLLPPIANDLNARDHLALLLAGATIGLFVALPLAGGVVARIGGQRSVRAGMVGYLAGSIVAATATSAWTFGAGQLVTGMAGGLLAVFGISAVIRHLDGRLRVRVIAASSAMWIVPALIGPPATLAVEHLVGWRWALLIPVPFVLIGRLLVARATIADGAGTAGARRVGRTLLVPIGVTGLVIGSAIGSGWPIALLGGLLAIIGVTGLLPRGIGRLTRGAPAALAAMLLFATGYFGADSLVTILFTDGYLVSLAKATIVLSAAPLAWAVTSLLMPRLVRTRGSGVPAAIGLMLAAVGTAGLAAFLPSATFVAALAMWTLGGVGVGLAYPGLYLLCTTVDHDDDDDASLAVERATAVITAEAFGSLFGRAVGGAVVSVAVSADLPRTGLLAIYGMFAALLAVAAVAAAKATAQPRAQG